MKELIGEKLKQIKEAKHAVNELIRQWGEQNRAFQDGDMVKIKINDHRAKVVSARFGVDVSSCDGNVKIEYLVKKLATGSCAEWVSESDIEIIKKSPADYHHGYIRTSD